MILGFVRPLLAPEPLWLSALGLQSVPTGSGLVRLATSDRASHYLDHGLAVVAEAAHTQKEGPAFAVAVADAYRQFGPGCAKHLPGRYRFIIYEKDPGRLVASSSTAPAWPLAYWSDSRTTIVCSRVLPMLRCPDVPRSLDESYLVHLVMGLSAMRDGSTAIRGVTRLGPGDALIVDSGGMRVARVDHLAPRHVRGDREELGRVFLDELGKAVAGSTRGRRSAISFSGGLDSAALVGAGLQHLMELPALSFVAPALNGTAEIESIDAMVRAWPNLHVTRVDASSAGELPDLGSELRDDPALTPLAFLSARMALWSRARETGFETLIEGEGGDELFSMLPTPLDALRQGHLLGAARHVMASSGRRALIGHGLVLPLLPRVLRRGWLAWRQPIEAYLPAFAVWDAGAQPAIREATGEYLEALVHRSFEAHLNAWQSAPMVVGAALSRRHAAAGFGLELEWPMLERGVLELVLGLHAAEAIHRGPTKPFLQAALAGVIPNEVRLRSKNISLYRAFIPRVLTSSRTRQVLRDARVRSRLAGLVRFDRIEAMLDGLAAGKPLGMSALWQLECAVCFAEWYGRASREYGVD